MDHSQYLQIIDRRVQALDILYNRVYLCALLVPYDVCSPGRISEIGFSGSVFVLDCGVFLLGK
jgi:hypothetical protein